jgi:beta-N-acetylhexosaminidase
MTFLKFSLVTRFALIVVALFATSFTRVFASEPIRESIALNAEDEATFKKLNLRQKVGQLLIIGYQGSTMEEGLRESMKDVRPGGLIVFSRNILSARQISDLNIDAQKLSQKFSRLPLLIGTDQEGGNVIRIKTAYPLPSSLAFGDAGDPELVERAGKATGDLMKSLGFNMNFAPVLDIADPGQRTFVGSRAYGSDPHLVAKLGTRFAAGLAEAGVLPTGKHFPGHGGIDDDSHQSLPKKSATLEELKKTDLIPFEAMQAKFKNRWAVMMAHIAYPQLDPTETPATFSKPIVDGVLRKQMGFNGVVVTDDIEMGGAVTIKDSKERAIRAIEAGADMIVITWNRKLQRDLLYSIGRAVKTGRLSRARIDEIVRRIMAAKRLYASQQIRRPTATQLRVALQNPEFGVIAQKTVTAKLSRPLDAGETGFVGSTGTKPVIVFASNQRFLATFKSAMKGRRVKHVILDVANPVDVNQVMKDNPKAVGVFYVSGQQVARIANRIGKEAANRMLVVTVEARGVLKNGDSFSHVSDVYYRHPQLGQLVAQRFFPKDGELRGPASTASTTDERKSNLTQHRMPD